METWERRWFSLDSIVLGGTSTYLSGEKAEYSSKPISRSVAQRVDKIGMGENAT